MSASSGAVFSDCRRYRYALWREWGGPGARNERGVPQMVVIGLNPSTADETEDDPTIRRCIGFAKREGWGKLVMLNLFAFRATDPKAMFAATDPVGQFINDTVIQMYASDPNTARVIAAWGKHGTPERVSEVCSFFRTIYCLGRNKDGSPKHPLYLPASASLELYRGERPLGAA